MTLCARELGAMRILSILVRTDTEKVHGGGGAKRRSLQGHPPGADHATLVVDNALPGDFVEHRPRRTLIGGDNSSSEFSGWDRGIETIGDELPGYDLIHLVTSAFNTLDTAYLTPFTTKMLRAIV